MAGKPTLLLATMLLSVGHAPEPASADPNAYFGDLHIHTQISADAVGDPALLFHVARYEENLDFIAITDHDTTMDAGEWDLTRALASAANVPGVFVAFSGIEWTHPNHIAVYFLGDDEAFCTNCNTVQEFYSFYGDVLTLHEAGAHVAHPVTCCSSGVPNLDDSLLPNVEIWNGRHESFDQEYGTHGALELLGQGHQLGFLGTSDDHSFDGTGEHSRRLGETLTGCHASSLTRAAILEALRDRRCFATDNLRTVVDLDVEGIAMGGEAEICEGASFGVDLFVSGTQTPSLVEIVEDGLVIASRSDCVSPDCNLSASLTAPETSSNIYGRVHHDVSSGCVNCKTWSSPVQVSSSTEPTCLPEPSRDLLAASGLALLLGLAKARRHRASARTAD